MAAALVSSSTLEARKVFAVVGRAAPEAIAVWCPAGFTVAVYISFGVSAADGVNEAERMLEPAHDVTEFPASLHSIVECGRFVVPVDVRRMKLSASTFETDALKDAVTAPVSVIGGLIKTGGGLMTVKQFAH